MLETNKKQRGTKMNKKRKTLKPIFNETIISQMDLHAMEIILIRNFMEISVLDCKVYAKKYNETFGAVAVSDLVNFYSKNIERDKEETIATILHDIHLLRRSYPETCVPRTLK